MRFRLNEECLTALCRSCFLSDDWLKVSWMVATPDIVKFLIRRGYAQFETRYLGSVKSAGLPQRTTSVVCVTRKGKDAIFKAMCKGRMDVTTFNGDLVPHDAIDALEASLTELPVYLASSELGVRNAAKLRARYLGTEI